MRLQLVADPRAAIEADAVLSALPQKEQLVGACSASIASLFFHSLPHLFH